MRLPIFAKKLNFWLVLIIVTMGVYLIYQKDFTKPDITWGATFSPQVAVNLGLDWKKTYLAMLDDWQVKNIRLVNYWQNIEKSVGVYNFDDIDWQLAEAKKRGVKVIMTIGRRQPRWPECHDPAWLSNYPQTEARAKVLDLLAAEVNHFKNNSQIVAWQLENEPLLSLFGSCPTPDKKFLQEEYDYVLKIDSTRPVYLTDSGELSGWFRVASISPYLGTTMYRVVWNKYLGVWSYHWPPAYYKLHAFLVKTAYKSQRIIVSELQAEPWTWKNMKEMSIDEQNKTMDLKRLKATIAFAKKTGFDEYYLWGVEWMYWRKITGDPSFWNETKKLWRQTLQ